MASAWQGLGAAVTLLARDDGLLPGWSLSPGNWSAAPWPRPEWMSGSASPSPRVRRPGGTGPVIVTLEDGGEVEAGEVLFATGRQPLTDDIGLDTVGLVPGSWLEVDDTCLVQPVDPAPWGPHAVTADYRAVPQVFFCDPPVGAVGLTADRAERAGHRIRVVDVDLGQAVPGAGLYADGYTGRARMVVDEDHDYLLGVTFVGPGVEELIHLATIAVAGRVPISRLWHAVPCFPSISEVWLRLLDAYRA